MKICLLFSLWLIFNTFPSWAQPQQVEYSFSIDIKAFVAGIDVLEHLYLIDQNNIFRKYDRNGVELSFYNNRSLMVPGNFDLTNPHKILLFYPQHQTIVFLDRNLTKISSMELSNLGLPEISYAAISNDNQIWVYDEFEHVLKKIDLNGSVKVSSENSYSLWGVSIEPIKIIERFNTVLLLDPQNGIFIYDNMGTPQIHREMKGIIDIDFISRNNLLLTLSPHRFLYYSLSQELKQQVPLPENLKDKKIRQLKFKGDQMLILEDDRVSIYKRGKL
nr:hypothetical protein [Saprospiraceae bacterium]